MSCPTSSSLRKQGSKDIRHFALGSWAPAFAAVTKRGIAYYFTRPSRFPSEGRMGRVSAE
jgi:hypothetical protein